MKQTFIKLAIAAIVALLLSSNASAYTGSNYRSFSGLTEMAEVTADNIDQNASLFVDPNGDDNNTGTIDAPFKTIRKAIDSADCENTIYLRDGTYNEAITINKSNLTLRNYPGENAAITGNNLAGTIANIIIAPNLTNISIYGLHIQDRQELDIEAAYGIIVHGGTRNIIIQNNEFQNINGNIAHHSDVYGYNAGGIVLFGNQANPIQNALIAGNKLHDMDCGKSEAITVAGYTNKVDVIENEIHDIFNIGIDIAGHYGANSDPNKDYARYVYVAGNKVVNGVSTIADNSGIYVDGAKGVLVERNYVEGCPFGISVDQENDIADTNLHVEDIIVSSNLFVNNLKGGIRIGTAKLLASSVFNSTIINNTVIHPNTAGTGALVVAKSHDNEIVNNVIIDQGTWNNIVFTDDYSTPNEIYNTTFRNNYLWSPNRLWFVDQKYLHLAGSQYTEAEFDALDFTYDNILGQRITLNSDYSAVAETALANSGYNHSYKSILRDYNGDLGIDTISLGYINVDKKTDTAADLAALTDVFPFKKNYIINGVSWSFTSLCSGDNPNTLDNIATYVAVFGMGCLAIAFVKKHARR